MKFALSVLLLSLTLVSNSQAKVWSLPPAQAVSGANPEASSAQSRGLNSLGTEAQPESEVYFRFDLSPLAEDGNLVNIVSLEWPLDGVNPDSLSTFYIYGVSDPAAVPPGSVPSTNDDDLIGIWEFSPLDSARNEGGFVLFDLSQITKDWLAGARQNLGVVIKTSAVAQDQLQTQLANARMVVR